MKDKVKYAKVKDKVKYAKVLDIDGPLERYAGNWPIEIEGVVFEYDPQQLAGPAMMCNQIDHPDQAAMNASWPGTPSNVAARQEQAGLAHKRELQQQLLINDGESMQLIRAWLATENKAPPELVALQAEAVILQDAIAAEPDG